MYCENLLNEAKKELRAKKAKFNEKVTDEDVAYVVLSGLSGKVTQITRKVLTFDAAKQAKKQAAADKEWQQERATQAGMAFGCAGYNDAMGY